MKTSALIVTFALALPATCINPTLAADTPVIQSGQAVAPLYRVNLYVRNINESLKLYRDLLRLKPVSDDTWTTTSKDDPFGANVKVHRILLTAGDPSLGNLALYELSGGEKEERAPYQQAYGHTADFAVVFPTTDIWNINDQLHKDGYIVLSPPVTLLENPELQVQNVEMQFRDHDGNLVNLLQAGIKKGEKLPPSLVQHTPEVMGTAENTHSKQLIERSSAFTAPITFHDGYVLAPMARATTFVRDRDRSLKLYRDILGLKPMFDNYWDGIGINRIKGTQGLEQHAVVYMAGELSQGNIGVYQLYKEKSPPLAPSQSAKIHTGDISIVLAAKDVAGLSKKIKDAGFVTVAAPQKLEPATKGGQQQIESMARDPDGIILTLAQVN